VLNTADNVQSTVDFAADASTKAPPRAVLAFAGSA
jgi:isoamylase